MENKRIYVASPFGFSESGRLFLKNNIHPFLEKLGFEVVSPWELTEYSLIHDVSSLQFGIEKRDKWKQLNKIIAKNNEEGILSSNFVFAILDGVDVDSGTAAEIGFAYANGKQIIGYRSDFRYSGDNEGAKVNLQVEYFITNSGGCIIEELDDKIVRSFLHL